MHSVPGTLATFLIGAEEDQKTYLIHKEYACKASSVFNAAFNSPFIEGRTQTYKLEDTSSNTFKFISQWMYSGSLTVLTEQSEESQEAMLDMDPPYYDKSAGAAAELEQQEFKALLEAWVLADKLCMSNLQNEVLTKLNTIIEDYIVLSGITRHLQYIYDNSCVRSALWKYFVELQVMDECKGREVELPE